ncbi:acetyl-CoA synthetase-like protein [Trametopsis cervina]|nr:acetyl-CoA synthetase-like protein [Trametopsis cervina]
MLIPLEFINSLSSPPAGVSLGDFLVEHVADSGRVKTFLDCMPTTLQPALHSPDDTREAIRHDELREFIASFSLPFSHPARRLGPNDRVMVVLPTTPENGVALLALASYHTTAPVNATCTASELFEDAERLGAKAVFSTPDAEERLELRELREKLGCEIIYMHQRSTGPCGLFDMTLMDIPREFMCDYSAPSPTQLHGMDDQSMVLHTSGTSGKKKVVPYTLRSLIVGTCAVIVSWDLQEKDVNMNMMPLFHVGGIVRNLFAPMLSGGSAIMCAGFDAGAFWSLSMKLGSTWYYAAPTMHQAILNSKPDCIEPSRDTKYRLICNAAGGLLPVLAQELKRTFRAVILPSYGSTECMPIASPPTTYQLERPGCSGIACGPYLSIRDPLDLERELTTGQTGAVCVRGIPTFTGYETVADRSVPLDRSAFSTEGWFDSGDCGYMDKDGYLFITGRSKEIINRGGEVISPFEIEEAILIVAKSRVNTTIAFSVDHDILQEAIGVVIVPQPNVPRISLNELQDLLKDHLHPAKWPFVVVYMDDLPKNNAGKPLRIKLASRLDLGMTTDALAPLDRHYEAIAPDKNVPLSQPIPCSRVAFDIEATCSAIADIVGVEDVAARRHDGYLEAFVYVSETSLDAGTIRSSLRAVLDGYCIPDSLYVFDQPLPMTHHQVDFKAIEEIVERNNASKMSPRALLVRDIVAELLSKDPALICGESDFFLLGGNSLLLGRLAYSIRKETGVSLKVADLFNHSTIQGLATLIDTETIHIMAHASGADDSTVDGFASEKYDGVVFGEEYQDGQYAAGRSQLHPLVLIVQAIPLLFFYPLKAAWNWTVILVMLAFLADYLDHDYWTRAVALIVSILAARLTSRIICPIAAVCVKWIVIGRYKPGLYPMYGNYHLRWWIVNGFIRSSGRGFFALHPRLLNIHCWLLGASVGKGVYIDQTAALGEFDLLTFKDGCKIDKALIRGFCVERDGYFRLAPIVIGANATINTYTQIAPGAVIEDNSVWGPHASSHEHPSPDEFVKYNRVTFRKPAVILRILVAAPIIVTINFISYIPWLAAIYGMVSSTDIISPGLNSIESVISWFSHPNRVAYHALARVLRVVATPLVQVFFGIIVKRLMGLNKEGSAEEVTQFILLRRYINQTLLSQHTLKHAFDVLGTHYEATSIVFRAMGAKVGKRVYWPGSGIYCPDPELLDIGDDVVFGSRSELFTTDNIGSDKITVGQGAMIADRVVLLPGSKVGRRTVMGSGALGRRNGTYEDGSTWMGNDGGEAAMFSKGLGIEFDPDTITPFGKAFYKRTATYFVLPYSLLVLINIIVSAGSAAFWSIPAVAAAQILNQLIERLPHANIFATHWYRPGILYGLIAAAFVVFLFIQSMLAMAWVIGTKWAVIGQRVEGTCAWDTHSYCQRWQIHLTLARLLYRGHGNGGVLAPITGSAYIVWFYRALGANIGKNVSIWAGGRPGLMTEPDLVTLGDRVSLDDCSVVAHINSRGKFALNKLSIATGCALRTGSRLLSGAHMESYSMLLEHALLASGDIAENGAIYAGWPARQLDERRASLVTVVGREEPVKTLSKV